MEDDKVHGREADAVVVAVNPSYEKEVEERRERKSYARSRDTRFPNPIFINVMSESAFP